MHYLLGKNTKFYPFNLFDVKNLDNLTAFISSLPRKGYNHKNFLF